MFFVGIILAIGLMGGVDATIYNSVVSLPPAPILLISASVSSTPGLYTNITVAFISMDQVQVQWKVDDGFAPTDLNAQAEVSVIKENATSYAATVSLPVGLSFEKLQIHLANSKQSFEEYLELHVSHGMYDTYEYIHPYLLFVPREMEVGISPRGTAFYVLVNTTGTSFNFGMLQAEMTLLDVNNQIQTVENDVTYSFLPDSKTSKIRISKVVETRSEYHGQVFFSSHKLHKTGGIVSILAACTSHSKLISRLDIKQSLNLHPMPGTLPLPKDSIGFVDISMPRDIKVAAGDKTLIRCKAVGNPIPKLSLLRKHGISDELYIIPSYETSLQFEVNAAFQFLNISSAMEGHYACRASNGKRRTDNEQTISISVVSNAKVQV